jgi:hypothetical protein
MIRTLAFALWELPQNALGVARFAVAIAQRRVARVALDRGRVMIELREGAAVSLGAFVSWTRTDNHWVPVGEENRDHEFGHAIQSRMLGPLYLPLVGVPSTARVAYAVAYRVIRGERWAHYYDGWPENAADRLGGVDRSLRPRP